MNNNMLKKITNMRMGVCSNEQYFVSDDVANASLFLMNKYSSDEIINIGCGEDYTIKDIVEIIKDFVGYDGKIVWDTTKSNGTPKRLLDNSKLSNLGWFPKVQLKDGLKDTYNWYLNNL